MPATPKRRKAAPPEGSEFLPDIVGRTIQGVRKWRRLSQQDVAERMQELGLRWYGPTVGLVEKGLRSLSVEELFGLALALETTVANLLDTFPMLPSTGKPLTHLATLTGTIPSYVELGTPQPAPAQVVRRLVRPSEDQGEEPPVGLVVWIGNKPRSSFTPEGQVDFEALKRNLVDAGKSYDYIVQLLARHDVYLFPPPSKPEPQEGGTTP